MQLPPATKWLLKILFKQELEAFIDIIERAQVERAAAFIVELRAKLHPNFSRFLDAALAGSSAEALAALSEFHPAIGEIPNALNFVAALQEQLRNPPATLQ